MEQKLNEIVERIISNGYDSKLASEMVKNYIKLYFQNAKNGVSIYVEAFINTLSQSELSNKTNVKFAGILKMEERDNDKSVNGIFYEFKSMISQGLMHFISSSNLIDIFSSAGIVDKEHGQYKLGKIDGFAEMLSAENNADLIQLSISDVAYYMSLNDLRVLLSEKGIDEDCYNIIWGKYGLGPRYHREVEEEGLYFDVEAISKKLANNQSQKRK